MRQKQNDKDKNKDMDANTVLGVRPISNHGILFMEKEFIKFL